MSQLWAKDLPLDALVHRFTVGDDPVTDLALVRHDAVGSAAHARGLHRAGLLDTGDLNALLQGLARIVESARAGDFTIAAAQEDCHTAIEQALGDAGRRIHLGRSRNDQVQLALRLLMRERVFVIADAVAALAGELLAFGATHRDVPLPGYTHMRRAMPSSFGQWASGFAEGLLEEVAAADALLDRIDSCPLGAAAGYGVPLPLDREYTAALLGFSRVQRSTVDAQNSRGRHEVAVTAWLASVSLTVEKLCWDLALYSTDEYGFVSLPDGFTTGSSIMPQKRNPDVVELARGRCRSLRGRHALVMEIAAGLPSGYHRDLQLLKRPLVEALDEADNLFTVLARVVQGLRVNAARAAAACTPEVYAAHDACRRVAAGMPFRDAYRAVAAEIAKGGYAPDTAGFASPHTGGLDDLQLDETAQELTSRRAVLATRHETVRRKLEVIFDVR